MMGIEREPTGSQDVEWLEQISSSIAVGLSKGQPVSRSNGVGINLRRPVFRSAADVTHFKPCILPHLMLDAQVILQGIGRGGTEVLANAGNA